MSFISIATFIVALAFALVSIYIAKILLRVSKLLKTLGQAADNVEHQLDKTVQEVGRLVVGAETTATDVENKLIATEGLFSSLSNVGNATSIISIELHNQAKSYGRDLTIPGTKKFVRAIQWSEYANVLLESWQRGKKVSI